LEIIILLRFDLNAVNKMLAVIVNVFAGFFHKFLRIAQNTCMPLNSHHQLGMTVIPRSHLGKRAAMNHNDMEEKGHKH
jgi:hypothetical protein